MYTIKNRFQCFKYKSGIHISTDSSEFCCFRSKFCQRFSDSRFENLYIRFRWAKYIIQVLWSFRWNQVISNQLFNDSLWIFHCFEVLWLLSNEKVFVRVAEKQVMNYSYSKLATRALCVFFMVGLGIPAVPVNSLSSRCLLNSRVILVQEYVTRLCFW